MLDALIQSQGPRLFSLCCRLCRSRGEAEDLYQETLLRGLEQRERLLAAENPGAYLTRICVNLYRDWARRRKLLSFISMEDAPRRIYMDSFPQQARKRAWSKAWCVKQWILCRSPIDKRCCSTTFAIKAFSRRRPPWGYGQAQ